MNEKLTEIGNEFKCPIAVLVKDKKVLLGYRHYTPDKWKKISVWTVPGGRCELGETIYKALVREVQEEVGITDFEVVDFIGEVDGAKEGDVVPVFFCTTKQDYVLMEPEKFSEWRWVPIKEYIVSKEYAGFNPLAKKIIINYLNKYLEL